MRAFKITLGIILCVFAFCWGITALIEKQALWLIGTGVCTALAAPLFRKTKKEKTKTEVSPDPYLQGVPQETLKEMRHYYTLTQAQNDARIMQESFYIAQQTTNLDTFCMRYELCQKKALTLLQAEKAGVRGIQRLKAHEACVSILNTSHALRIRALHDCTQDAVINAEAMKTTKGKANKYAKLLHSLEAHENVFIGMEEYTTVYNKVKARIFELIGGNAGE